MKTTSHEQVQGNQVGNHSSLVTERPNFLVIMTDDQGAWARGRTMPELITPTLDELGATGRELTRFFCASPVCSPARASLLTGRMPSAHGVHDWLRSENSGVDSKGVHYLESFITTPEVLAGNGYSCGHAGKWHLGDATEAPPGFSRWYSHRDGGGPYFGAPMIEDGLLVKEERYLTHAISEGAAEILTELAKAPEPFYLQVNYTAPHSPWSAENHPAEYRDLYDGCAFESVPVLPMHEWFNTEPGGLIEAMNDRQESLTGYCASLTAVDRGVQGLLGILEAAGTRENTYVIFTSDNGFSCGHHGIWGKGNGTLPLNVWDESILVPFIINRPGTIAPAVDTALTSAVSLHPTILELAGLQAPADGLAAGKSVAARLLGGTPGPANAIVVFDEYGGTRMIRTETHKYVSRFGDAPDELYDLNADPTESRSLHADPAHSELRKELHARLEQWFSAHSDPGYDAFARPVAGRGQDSPVWTAQTDGQRYA